MEYGLDDDATTATSRSASPVGEAADDGHYDPADEPQFEPATRAAHGAVGGRAPAADAAGGSHGSVMAVQGGGGDSGGGAREYDPEEFTNLNVTDAVRDLFKYIGRYRPAAAMPPAPLKPFIPEYIPALGGVDEFIKVPRPDGRPDFLGLKVLDEPAALQSDPGVLALQLRQLSRAPPRAALDVVSRLAHGNDQSARAKGIDAWIASVADVHKKQPPATVHYTTQLPTIEALMQELPQEVEAALRDAQLPGPDMDLDVPALARLVCALLDVPVADGAAGSPGGRPLLEALHQLFVLLLEFRANPYFQQALGEQAAGLTGTLCSVGERNGGGVGGAAGTGSSRLGTALAGLRPGTTGSSGSTWTRT